MDKKVLQNRVRTIMRNEGYTVKNNKFVIEYPQCYVLVDLMFPRGVAELCYNISVKEIHGTLTKDQMLDYSNYDFSGLPKLNYEHGLYDDCHFDLFSLEIDEVEPFIKKQLEKYIKPFENDLINYLKRGRLFKYIEDTKPHYEQFYMEKALEEYLSKK